MEIIWSVLECTRHWKMFFVGFFNALTFHDGGPYHIETSPLIYRANQWTDFYMIGTTVMKELTIDNIPKWSKTL